MLAAAGAAAGRAACLAASSRRFFRAAAAARQRRFWYTIQPDGSWALRMQCVQASSLRILSSCAESSETYVVSDMEQTSVIWSKHTCHVRAHMSSSMCLWGCCTDLYTSS